MDGVSRAKSRVVPSGKEPVEGDCRRLEGEVVATVGDAHEEDRPRGHDDHNSRQEGAPDPRARPDPPGAAGERLIVVEDGKNTIGELRPDLSQADRASRLESEQLLVTDCPNLSESTALGDRRRQVPDVPEPRDEVASTHAPAEEDQVGQRVEDRDEDLEWHHPEQGDGPVGLEHGPQTAGFLPPST